MKMKSNLTLTNWILITMIKKIRRIEETNDSFFSLEKNERSSETYSMCVELNKNPDIFIFS